MVKLRQSLHFSSDLDGEHPAGASSWREEGVERLAEADGVKTVSGHMCQYGMKSCDALGEGLVYKGTTILTNLEPTELSRRTEMQTTKL